MERSTLDFLVAMWCGLLHPKFKHAATSRTLTSWIMRCFDRQSMFKQRTLQRRGIEIRLGGQQTVPRSIQPAQHNPHLQGNSQSRHLTISTQFRTLLKLISLGHLNLLCNFKFSKLPHGIASRRKLHKPLTLHDGRRRKSGRVNGSSAWD